MVSVYMTDINVGVYPRLSVLVLSYGKTQVADDIDFFVSLEILKSGIVADAAVDIVDCLSVVILVLACDLESDK